MLCFRHYSMKIWGLKGFPGGLSHCLNSLLSHLQCRRPRRRGFDPWIEKILWRRGWQPTPVFLSGDFCGQRSLVGYSPWGCKETAMTEQQTDRQMMLGTISANLKARKTDKDSSRNIGLNLWHWRMSDPTPELLISGHLIL